MIKSVVITDTSVLINFLVLDQLHVLSQLTEFDFSVTEHVRAEITEHFPEQLQRPNAAFEAGSINEICVTDIVEVRLFAELTTQGLGIGECSAVAVALNRGIRIAIDDKRAIKKISRLGYKLDTISTSELTVCLIKAAILTVEVADNFKKIWEVEYRFKLPFSSFAEFIGPTSEE